MLRGHFEITETSFMEMREFEYDARRKYGSGNNFKEEAPVILNGGRIDKVLTTENDCPDRVMVNGVNYPIATRTRYMIIGGRLQMETYSQSTHPRRGYLTRHCPVSVMGGEFDQFYLSGLYVPNGVTTAYPDNPYCYINGGRFGEMAGSGYDKIRGSVNFSIDHARIHNFYGGGINAAMPINGSITVYIDNSIVDQYCGGPKFGDMPGNMSGSTNSVITTVAENTRFGIFYGAGYGGTSFTNELLFDNGANNFHNKVPTPNQWRGFFGGYVPKHYVEANNTYQVQYKYEYWNLPAGCPGDEILARLYSLNAQFTTSRSGDANSTLTNCEVLRDCYGGGCFGAVSGNTMLSLTTTTVHGSVYGGGFSHAQPSFELYMNPNEYSAPDEDFPRRNAVGVCIPGKIRTDGITYYWTNKKPDGIDENNPDFLSANGDTTYFYTNVDMRTLGEVEGNTQVYMDGCTIYGDVFGGGNRSDVHGNAAVGDFGVIGYNTTIGGNVYGGGNIASTFGNTTVELEYSTVGEEGVSTAGSVFGGGKGALSNNNYGKVGGNATVTIGEDCQVYNNVYGGGEYASVGDPEDMENTGMATVNINGGEVGPLDMTGLNAYVYGGGKGVEIDQTGTYKNFANVNNASVSMSGGQVWGSLFGGGADGHVLGDAEVNLSGGTVGTNGQTSWDGNIFGGGRNYRHTNKTAGRVGGNITVNMSGGTLKGNIYGGGRLGNTGVDVDGVMQEDEEGTNGKTYGHIKVNVTGGTIGYDFDPDNGYEPKRYIDTIGCVYGGAKGITYEKVGNQINYISNWDDFANAKTTEVNISGSSTYLWGNVYGGSEQGLVRDSTNVTIGGGATVRLRAFAGGRGFLLGDNPDYKHAGDVGESANGTVSGHGLARITLKENAKVEVCLYGGANIASVHGNAYTIVDGGKVGRNRTLSEIRLQPTHCYVFGSSKGTNKHGEFNTWSNVDTAYVYIKPGSRIYGSVFGGGEDGHVLGDVHLDINMGENDIIGTHGYSKVDGNIFSGGRGFEPQALTVGGVRGNIYTHIYTEGTIAQDKRPVILGSVFGGGRIASTGIQLVADEHAGDTIPDTATEKYGYTHVTIEGDIVIGHDYKQEVVNGKTESFKIGDIGGNVYGGAMGNDVAPTTTEGKMSHVKNAEVTIKGNVWVKGSVNGGGESGSVWKNTKVTIDENCTIGVDRIGSGLTQPLDSLLYSGNVFGGSWGSDSKSYVNLGRVYGNDTVIIHGGHIRNNIYGGGEYASIGSFEGGAPKAGTGHCVVIMDGGELGPLDMSGINAYVFGGGKGEGNDADNQYKDFGQVFSAHVQIKPGARVYGSIFGGGEDGHVTDTVRVSVTGGTIGTTGLTTWDGNIFGGGRNYLATNFAAGRVGGNIHVDVEGGSMYGSVYGGGRLASVGVDDEGNAFTDNPEDHGHTFVTIKGGTIGFVPESGHCEMDSIRGNVYGGCKGIVNKPQAYSVNTNLLSNVTTTHVVIQDGAIIKGSVFGGGEDGHVLSNTNITITGGQIGDDESVCSNKQHGNVYGGGRGLGKDATGTFVEEAGTVNGNSLVTITGGFVKGNVYGGGQLASVGLRNIGDNNDPNPNTGWARVKISGGTIGTTENLDNERGNVFGSSRGVAGTMYKDYAYVNNTLVTLSSGTEVVKGNVFGSGDDGHVLLNTQVTINGGQVGSEGVSNSNKGCVYGGGRGLNLDANGSLSPTAGLVKGDSKVSIQSGVVYGDVFGGGNASAVTGHKLVDVLKPATGGAAEIHGNVYGGCKSVPSSFANLNLGLKTVNVRGGHIMGSVFGCSYNTIDGDLNLYYYDNGNRYLAYQDENGNWHYMDDNNNSQDVDEDKLQYNDAPTSFVNIDGGIIDGDVYGAGWSGEVKGSVGINIGANAIAYDDPDDDPDAGWLPRPEANVKYDDNGGLPIVVFGNVRDINVEDGSLTFTGFLVDEGAPKPGARYKGFCWSTSEHPTIESDTVRKSFVLGDVGNFSISVPSGFSSGTYYVRAFATNPTGTSYSPEMTFTMEESGTAVLADNQPEPERVIYTPTANKLHIKGSVYGGSNHIGSDPNANNWGAFDVTGLSFVLIDGTGYDTEHDETANASNASNPPYFNIGGGLFGSGTHCESGELGRHIYLNEYGHRNEGDEFTQATRTLTTIQRCDNVLLTNSNINLSGHKDISSSHDQRNYAVMKVDKGLYIAEASALNLGTTAEPAYMDSIRMVRSVLVHSDASNFNDPIAFWVGTDEEQAIISNSDTWDWVGLKNNQGTVPAGALGTELYRITSTGPSDQPLTKAQENVIIFNGDSRMWVRYHDNTGAQKYGELNGFFRMKSPFKPRGKDSFAYARPKLTTMNGGAMDGDELNKGDGGFLSYETDKNFHTLVSDGFLYNGNDGGDDYTYSKQYPYTNVMAVTRGDVTDYREWVIRTITGRRWYVDGTRGWGRDDLSKTAGWGLYPDKPKKTVYGALTYDENNLPVNLGGICTEVFEAGNELNYNYEEDAIFVVGAISAQDEAGLLCGGTVGTGEDAKSYPLLLYRYPGGHPVSWYRQYPTVDYFDNGDGTLNLTTENTGLSYPSKDGPGANYGAMLDVQANQTITLNNVQMDGLYGHNSVDDKYLWIPGSNYPNPSVLPYPATQGSGQNQQPLPIENIQVQIFNQEGVFNPMIVTHSSSTLSMEGTEMNGTGVARHGTIIERGFNNTDAEVWYTNADYAPMSNTYHGGALYVDKDAAAVNVKGSVNITDNKQLRFVPDPNGGNTSTQVVIESNVYLPTFAKHLNITDNLIGSSIGITSPIRNKERNYIYNTFSPIAVANKPDATEEDNATIAQNAWDDLSFYDDLDWFFVNEDQPLNGHARTSYYSKEIDDHPGKILESETTQSVFPRKTIFFGWTWANVVRKAPTRIVDEIEVPFSHDDIKSPEELAWIISEVNGLNGQQGHPLAGSTLVQTSDIDLQQYVWVPIGIDKLPAKPFSGSYEGRGHLITNMDIDYIGYDDGRYEYSDYGLFGYVVSNANNQGIINRTFLVSGLIRPEGTANMGGLIGKMHGENAMISNSEAALRIVCPNTSSAVGAGGLVGKMQGGTIHSSMAMPDIEFKDRYYAAGGLVGYADDNAIVKNSFANAKFTIPSGDHTTHGAGGLIGDSRSLTLENCYSHLYDNTNLPKFYLFVANKVGANITDCYGFKGGKILQVNGTNEETDYEYCNTGNENLTTCGKYTLVMSADNLGYMYYDNTLTIDETTTPMFEKLNEWVGSSTIYSKWARPALAEINHDLPVLLLDEGSNYQGKFRSVATYKQAKTDGMALQYGGPVRDGAISDCEGEVGGENTPVYTYPELDGALDRADANNCIFIYDDITKAPTKPVNAKKVSIHENAAILRAGSLAENDYTNTYVGITFDNSFGHAWSTYGINYLSEQFLPRDWHMLSTPLQNAPLGFNYMVGETNTNLSALYPTNPTGTAVDYGTYYNNPWPHLHQPTTIGDTEFNWLQSEGSTNVRYWMKGWTNSQSQNGHVTDATGSGWVDGYFPSRVASAENNVTGFTFGEGCIEGQDEYGRYPYGMDFYTWTEPDYHWINFKRNGPNHWHSDMKNEHHDHIDYKPYGYADETHPKNVNEETLIPARSYMASISKQTMLQSHGTLNAGATSIKLTLTPSSMLPGWNMVGNPYHAYLDFTELAVNTNNQNVLATQNSNAFYVVYDADKFEEGGAFRYFVANGSIGGAYVGPYLHPHQGFFVKATGTKDLYFDESMTVARGDIDDLENCYFRDTRPNRPAYPLVNLYLSSEQGCADVTVIEFDRPDWGGAVKLRELRCGNGQFYGYHDNQGYAALFVKKDEKRVPLWFEAAENDVFTIKWETANADFHAMYLLDNLTGTRYDMLENDSYVFQGNKDDYKSRFYIVFSFTDIEEPEAPADNHFVFFDGSQWLVTGDGELEFIDLHGHVLWRGQVAGQTRVPMPVVAQGVYLFRLIGKEGTRVQKIVIHN
jgi:hypothetical protein